MSLKTQYSSQSLEITGNVLELPPVKEITKPLEKKPIESQKKRASFTTATLSAINRQNSQTKKPDSSCSLSKINNNNNNNNNNSNDKELIRQLEEEIRKLKKKIEELESQLKLSNKSNKDKDKIIDELNKKIENYISEANSDSKKIQELDELCEALKKENQNLLKQLNFGEDLNNKITKALDDNTRIRLEYETQIKKLKEEHLKEIKIKDEKLDLLKKQIANAFKDNSWERQSQIEELTKELKKTQEEYETLKFKLKGFKNKHGDSCENCEEMLTKVNEKTKLIQEKELLINELVNIMNKFKSQLNIQDDILKLAANKLYLDTNIKINNSQSKSINNSNSANNYQSNSILKTKK